MRNLGTVFQYQRGQRIARGSLDPAAGPLNVRRATDGETFDGDEDVAWLCNLEQDAFCPRRSLEPDQEANAEACDRLDIQGAV